LRLPADAALEKLIGRPKCAAGSRALELALVFALALNRTAAAGAEQDARDVGMIEGEVVARDTRRPVVGSVVIVEGTSLTALVDADGRFRIEQVSAAVHILRAEGPGYLPLSSVEIKVPANRSITVVLELERAVSIHEDVIVRAPTAPRPANVTTSSFELGSEEIRRSAGSMGELDSMHCVAPFNQSWTSDQQWATCAIR
jgi:hypothetical protein